MKKSLIITLGILNIVAFISTLILLGKSIYATYPDLRFEYTLTWGMPFIAIAAYALTIGIRTIKGKHWIWAIIGLILAGAAWLYFVWLALLQATV
jgi:hypothetical protein